MDVQSDVKTSRRVGRTSVVLERRHQITDAFIRLIAEHGLEHVTLDQVASAAHVQRAALRHFVGNREELVVEAMLELCRRYQVIVESSVGSSPTIDELIDTLFGSSWTRESNEEDAAFDALLAEGTRNPRTRAAVKNTYDVQLNVIARALRQSHPDAAEVEVRDTAYAIACLVEQNTTFQQLGYPRARHAAMKKIALRLIADLA